MNFGNIGALMKLMQFKSEFENNHPKMVAFFKAMTSKPLEAGTVIEITLTRPGEEPVSSNMKLTERDIQMLKELKELREQ